MPALGAKIETKTHPPDAKLVKYVKEKSSFERRKGELESAGKKLTKIEKDESNKELEEIERKLRTLQNTKGEVLDEIIFPSMANLTFFFKSVLDLPELNFESDIIQLLGIRRLTPRPWNYAFVFVNLVHAMISTKKGYKKNDFRIRLIHELQKQIWHKFQELSSEVFLTSRAFNTVNQDIERAMTWTEMIASKINDEYDFESKVSPFYPENIPNEYLKDDLKMRQYKEKRRKEREEEWDMFCAEDNPPHRRVDFIV